jgi:hypothetical protein
MTAPQIHPEDLLDRARSGSLGSDEQRLLKRHLALCAACRFELSLAPGLFAHVEVRPGDDELVARAVARTNPVRYARRRVGRKVLSATALVAAAAAMAAMASAGAYAWRRHTVARLEAPDLPPSHDVETSEPGLMTTAPHADAVVDPLRPAPPEPSSAVAERPKPRAPSSVSTPASCADRFRRANEARREGAMDEAVRLYLELRPACAGSNEEVSSRVLVGRIYLDRLSDPARALASFESYLGAATAGSLREDAMIGRALALGKLGRSAEEASAWKALLAAYPDSLYADKARSRLGGSR